MNEFEYYLIDSDYKPTTPLLRDDDDEDEDTWFLVEEDPVKERIEPLKLCFNSPIPKKVIMIDYHSLPSSVVSKKIFEVLDEMKIWGIQLLPAEIRNNKTNEIYSDYWVIYVYNKIRCLDMKNAEYTLFKSDRKVKSINKLILDREILSQIPLEKRLVFSLKEAVSCKVYHKSVVDAVLAANPEGVIFTPIEEWYEGIQFS